MRKIRDIVQPEYSGWTISYYTAPHIKQFNWFQTYLIYDRKD
jgi:hypothetical protein